MHVCTCTNLQNIHTQKTREHTKKRQHGQMHQFVQLRLCECRVYASVCECTRVCASVCECTHDGESVSVSLEAGGGGGQLARLCLGILQACSSAAPQLTSGGYQSNKDAQQCNYSASHSLQRHFFPPCPAPLPSSNGPVSFILMVRKSVSLSAAIKQDLVSKRGAAALSESERLTSRGGGGSVLKRHFMGFRL